MKCWYEQYIPWIADMTWLTMCTIDELCSKRFYKFMINKETIKRCKELGVTSSKKEKCCGT
jgi:hypothetical protein